MAAKYYTILTDIGKAKVANAAALGRQIKLTQLAIGDGDGNEYDPTEDQTSLRLEQYRVPISHLGVDSSNSNWIVAEGMIPVDVGGWFVREVGIFDDDGDLIAIGKYPETYKPTLSEGTGRDLYVRFIMVVSNVDTIDIKIDPTVEISTKTWVLETISKDKVQAKQLATFRNNIRAGNPVTICCLGDSLTYGYDTQSSDRLDGNTHGINGSKVDRASKQYPESMAGFLNDVYGDDVVTVMNRGYSGDTAQTAFDRWTTASGADATIIMLGTNDASSSWGTKVDVATYIDNYEKLILREISWGSAVIIAVPPTSSTASNSTLDTFRNALVILAHKYGISVVDTTEFISVYDYDSPEYGIHSDGTHFNGRGYEIIGAKMAAVFLGELFDNPVIAHDRILATRQALDGFTVGRGAYLQSNNGGAFTPNERVCKIPVGGVMTYSFYLEADTYVYPVAWLPASTVMELLIDFGTIRPLSLLNYKDIEPAGEQKYVYDAQPSYTLKDEYGVTGSKNPVVYGRGWHTVTIKNVSSSDRIVFNALSFLQFKPEYIKPEFYGYMTVLSHPEWSESPTPVSSLKVDRQALSDALKLPNIVDGQFYRNPLLKLTIESNSESFTYGYFYQLPSQGGGGTGVFIDSQAVTVDSSGTPDINPVKISNIAYDSTNDEFVITLDKTHSITFNITITIA
ncbi:phage tail protein (plasmid) [Vibrio cyclitrophicus]